MRGMVVRRIWVIVEIIAVFFAGSLLAREILRLLGIAGAKQAIAAAASGRFDPMAVAIPMTIRWSLVLLLAALAGWVFGRHRLSEYGFTLAGRSIQWHLRAAAVILAVGYLPVVLLLLARHHFGLPGGPPLWDALERAPRSSEFWLYILASSVVLPPIFEEIFFRGYAQTRLSSAYREMTAVLIISSLFVFAHVQYLDGSIVGTLMVVTGLWLFVVFGIARLRTGSLLAPIVAHAIFNIPMRAPERWAMAVVLAVVLVLYVRSRRLTPAAS